MSTISSWAVSAVLAFTPLAVAQDIAKLPPLNVDPAQVSVGGFSSGGTMAMQLGVAYSSVFKGVAVLAGVPYDCNRQGGTTQGQCDSTVTPDVTLLAGSMNRWSGREIDDVARIARQRIFVYVGSNDVNYRTLEQTAHLYARFATPENLMFDNRRQAGHVWPTDYDVEGFPSYPCVAVSGLYWANCGFDAAGASLRWIYGDLEPRGELAHHGQLTQFDQRAFATRQKGMDEVGWLYVPPGCASGHVCRLHVFLHGCSQSYFQRGDAYFAKYSGHSRWADTNDIVLLFPQTYPDDVLNVDGCWDDRGRFDDAFDWKAGTQTSAIVAMVRQITSGFTGAATAVEYYHPAFDHYFVAADPAEVAALDAGTFAGWQRSGESFRVYAPGTAGAAQVCRFFSTAFGARSSHFYTPDAAECTTVKLSASWQFEGEPFAVALPDASGGCGAGLQPLYRLYNDGQGGAPNHRYTIKLGGRAEMIARGWVAEGYGAMGVIACVLG